MSQDSIIPTATHVQALEQVARCRACGCPLNPAFYFCVFCATPYKSVETVLPIVRPAAPGWETLLQRKAPRVMTLFWTYLGVILAVHIFAAFRWADGREGWIMVVGSLALFVTTCVFAALHWRTLAVQFLRVGFFHWAAWAGLVALVPLLGLNYLWHHWLTKYMEFPDYGRSVAVVFICVFPALLEETAFRGLVQTWLHVAFKPITAMVLSSALFTALHLSLYSFPYLFAVGMLLAWMRWKTGSLYPGMLVHFLHNLAVVIAFF